MTVAEPRRLKMKSRKRQLMDLALKSGEKQLLNTWIEPCSGEDCDCENNMYKEYAMPDGTIQIEKTRLDQTGLHGVVPEYGDDTEAQ
ncbi:MAG: hypothetical protein ACI35R_04860 [Bacillus sp. (in: firmicutes)]